MGKVRAEQSFTYKGTTVQVGQAIEWYSIQPLDGSPAFFRVRNHSTGAEIKASPQELNILVRVILNQISTEVIEGL